METFLNLDLGAKAANLEQKLVSIILSTCQAYFIQIDLFNTCFNSVRTLTPIIF